MREKELKEMTAVDETTKTEQLTEDRLASAAGGRPVPPPMKVYDDEVKEISNLNKGNL